MRRRLNTESGVIICNHPGWGDAWMILSAIKRNDIKIMTNRHYIEWLIPSEVANKYFFSNDPKKAIGVFKRIQDHIKRGGILLIFPSAAKERGGNDLNFKEGFRVILRSLKPEQMVYCFNINKNEMPDLGSIPFRVARAAEIKLRQVLKKRRTPKSVRIDEAYTQAGEWQKAIEATPKNDATGVLTRKYEGMFSANK